MTTSETGAAVSAQKPVDVELVPGVMRCARCGFQLQRVTLYTGNGVAGPGDSKTEPCPNGCGPLWPIERCDRFIEEAIELAQSLGHSAERAHALVDYVYGRPKGEPEQEVGGVMVTLAALCLAVGIDMHAVGDKELDRIWTKIDAIRAKHAAKPTGSALPAATEPRARDAAVVGVGRRVSEGGVSLELRPITREEADAFVRAHHRHHGVPVGALWRQAVHDHEGRLIGVAVSGRPCARALDDGLTVEVTRLCTLGTANACSLLYGAGRRVAINKGYRRGITYILASEPGTSLKAAGWRFLWDVRGRSWDCPSRPRSDKHPTDDKQAWGWGAWPESFERPA